MLNLKKTGETRYPDVEDRVQCAENYNNFVRSAIKNCDEIKGKCVGMADFTKQAIELINGKTFNQFTTEQDILDAWNAASAETSTITVDIANKNILIAKVVRGAATNYILISITDLNDVTGSNNDFIEFQYKL